MKKRRDFIWDTGWTMTRFSRIVHQVSGKMPAVPDWAGETSHPPMDVFEDESWLYVVLEVPGMGRDELNVRLHRQKLIVEGFKHSGGDRDCLRYLCVEREFGVFRRSLDIPVSIDGSGVRARLADGLLRIRLPKVEERRQPVVDVPIDEEG